MRARPQQRPPLTAVIDTETRRRAAARGARRRDARARAALACRYRGRWLHGARCGARNAAIGAAPDGRRRDGGARLCRRVRGSEALAIRHISGRRRCAAVPHDVDRYTEPHYSAATLLQPRTLREGTTIKSGTLAVDQALLTSAAGAACPCVIQIGGPGIGDPHGASRAKARVTRNLTRASESWTNRRRASCFRPRAGRP